VSGFFQQLIQTGIYKRNQGRITRQVTFAAIALTMAMGLWRLSNMLMDSSPAWRFGVPGVLLAIGLWIAYRIVNMPNFTDFLIAVEAEMNKVSWPSRAELFRASMVVLVTIFFLAAVLFLYDWIWRVLFTEVLRIF